MGKQQNDIASCSNGKNMLIAGDSLRVTENYYAGIFAEKENNSNQDSVYSKIILKLIKIGGSKKNVTFFLDPDQAEYLYVLSKKFIDITYHSYKEGQKVRQLIINRQSVYNGQLSKYPWYIEIKEGDEKLFININDEQFFIFMNRIHRFIELFCHGYSNYIINLKLGYEAEIASRMYQK